MTTKRYNENLFELPQFAGVFCNVFMWFTADHKDKAIKYTVDVYDLIGERLIEHKNFRRLSNAVKYINTHYKDKKKGCVKKGCIAILHAILQAKSVL